MAVNPRYEQSFLFRYETGRDKAEYLDKMLAYVRNYHDTESPYTLKWCARGNRDLQTSYFRAHNVHKELEKLYFGRDLNTITLFSVVLDPGSQGLK